MMAPITDKERLETHKLWLAEQKAKLAKDEELDDEELVSRIEKEKKLPRGSLRDLIPKVRKSDIPKAATKGWSLFRDFFLTSLLLVLLFVILHHVSVISEVSHWIAQLIAKISNLGG
ncbi:MAG: hypothetical protein KGJ01_02475 [Patescibacteria group bacterium]|nr:hypothetical protein [Patescibacteria group bacterium]